MLATGASIGLLLRIHYELSADGLARQARGVGPGALPAELRVSAQGAQGRARCVHQHARRHLDAQVVAGKQWLGVGAHADSLSHVAGTSLVDQVDLGGR